MYVCFCIPAFLFVPLQTKYSAGFFLPLSTTEFALHRQTQSASGWERVRSHFFLFIHIIVAISNTRTHHKETTNEQWEKKEYLNFIDHFAAVGWRRLWWWCCCCCCFSAAFTHTHIFISLFQCARYSIVYCVANVGTLQYTAFVTFNKYGCRCCCRFHCVRLVRRAPLFIYHLNFRENNDEIYSRRNFFDNLKAPLTFKIHKNVILYCTPVPFAHTHTFAHSPFHIFSTLCHTYYHRIIIVVIVIIISCMDESTDGEIGGNADRKRGKNGKIYRAKSGETTTTTTRVKLILWKYIGNILKWTQCSRTRMDSVEFLSIRAVGSIAAKKRRRPNSIGIEEWAISLKFECKRSRFYFHERKRGGAQEIRVRSVHTLITGVQVASKLTS